MCGVATIPASSGKVVRFRLNRRGNRDANRAVHVVAAERLSRDERTRAYAERRTAEGKSRRETMRCLKRYIARELYKILVSTVQTYSYSRRHIAGAGLTGSIDGQWCLRPISTLFV